MGCNYSGSQSQEINCSPSSLAGRGKGWGAINLGIITKFPSPLSGRGKGWGKFNREITLSATSEGNFGKFQLGFSHRAISAFFLPVVDDFCSLIEQFNSISFSNPVFGLKLVLEFFPGIVPRPEKVFSQGTSAFADNLVNGKGDVLV